jgi:hypothetical protein
MPSFDLARNLIVSARQVDPDDAASVVLYGETSAPVDLRDGPDVGVEVTVTAVDTLDVRGEDSPVVLGGDLFLGLLAPRVLRVLVFEA